MSTHKDVVTPSAAEHLTGRVKWFNNKAGYGFLTVTDGIRSGLDIFVHHSAINVENQQYKYLVQGEYIEFDLIKTDNDKHEWQASNVSGIKGGKLMCETRHELKMSRNDYKSTKQPHEEIAPDEAKLPRQRTPRETVETTQSVPVRQRRTYAPRLRGEGPRDGENGDSKEWTLATKDGKNNKNGPPRPRGRPPRQSSATQTK